MKLTSAAALLSMVGAVAARKDNPDKRSFAVLRFTNKQLTKGRMDPIVTPGKVSTHVHTVMGGSGFGLGSTGKDLMASNCSTALVKGDNSNYWFPSLYFKDPKTGKLEDVEMFYANVYYLYVFFFVFFISQLHIQIADLPFQLRGLQRRHQGLPSWAVHGER